MADDHGGRAELPAIIGPFTVRERAGGDDRTLVLRAVDAAGLAVVVTVVRAGLADQPPLRARLRAEVDAGRAAGTVTAADVDAEQPWVAVPEGRELPEGLRLLLMRPPTPTEVADQLRTRMGTPPMPSYPPALAATAVQAEGESTGVHAVSPPAHPPAYPPAFSPPGHPPGAGQDAGKRVVRMPVGVLVLIGVVVVGLVATTIVAVTGGFGSGGSGRKTAAASASPTGPGRGHLPLPGPSGLSTAPASPGFPIRVAAFSSDPSGKALAFAYVAVLRHAGLNVSDGLLFLPNMQMGMPAMRAGAIDVVPIYTSLLPTLVEVPATASDEQVAAAAKAMGLDVGSPGPADDAESFAVTKTFASAHHLASLSDLAASGVQPRIAGDPGCATRITCLPLLAQYGVKGATAVPGSVWGAQAYAVVQRGDADLAETTLSTPLPADGSMVMLADDQHKVAPDHPLPLASAKHAGAILPALEPLVSRLTQDVLNKLNADATAPGANPQALGSQLAASFGLA